MNAVVTIDTAGRVVIPKAVRDELRLEPGDSLALSAEDDRVTLRPVRSASALQKERGIWVFRSGRNLSIGETNRAIERVREERERVARASNR